ncbi:hypothetical protein [Thermoactinospora rubra]|uniref:hypothetical protein n=1 Tax=Thermoactinospora rubra TaxID=1088767 RepID=UPI001F0AFB67|nr:hypothetical protein [Thermoactinospora rubra]
MLGRELPRREILLTELRDLLTSRAVTNDTRDVVWRELVERARREGAQWLVGAVGVAVPALRGIAGRICRGYEAGEAVDIDTEVLAAFIEAVRTIDLDKPAIFPRMCDAARRAGERVRELAESDVARKIFDPASRAPAAPWGHPDLVLADAVAKGIISELDAELIGLTRLEKRTLAEAADELGLSAEAAKKRRQRCGPVLIKAVLAGEVESALSLTITSPTPRRVEDTSPETSARSRITSDPQPDTTDTKGGRGNPTGSARIHHPARRRLLRWALVTVAVTAIVIGTAAAVLAAPVPSGSPPTRYAALPNDLNKVFENLRNWLIGLLAALATLMLTIGGLRYLVAGGDPGEVQKAKSALKAAAFGYGLAVLAPLFVNVLKRIVGG